MKRLSDNIITSSSGYICKNRGFGELVYSLFPLEENGLLLLNGQTLHISDNTYPFLFNQLRLMYQENPNSEFFVNSWDDIRTFTRPTLSANNTIGGDTFAVQANTEYDSRYQAFKAFDGNGSTEWATKGLQYPSWLTFYNPKPLNVTQIRIRNRSESTEQLFSGSIYGSNTNGDWKEIKTYTNNVNTRSYEWIIDLSDNKEYYNYYRITGTSYASGSTNPGFSELNMTATYLNRSYSVEEAYEYELDSYGMCDKFVYDEPNDTIILPKINKITQSQQSHSYVYMYILNR